MQQSAEMHLVDTLKAQTASLESEIKSLMLQNEEAEGKVERMRLLVSDGACLVVIPVCAFVYAYKPEVFYGEKYVNYLAEVMF